MLFSCYLVFRPSFFVLKETSFFFFNRSLCFAFFPISLLKESSFFFFLERGGQAQGDDCSFVTSHATDNSDFGLFFFVGCLFIFFFPLFIRSIHLAFPLFFFFFAFVNKKNNNNKKELSSYRLSLFLSMSVE